jgi:hypothetical protein
MMKAMRDMLRSGAITPNEARSIAGARVASRGSHEKPS